MCFVECCVSIYMAYLNIFQLDQESGFVEKTFWDVPTAHRIRVHFSNEQSYGFIICRKTYQDPLQNVLTVIRELHQTAEPKILLQYSMKWHSESQGSRYPVLFVSGTLLTFLIMNKHTPGRQKRFQMMMLDWDEAANLKAMQRIVTAIITSVPSSAKCILRTCDRVLSYSKTCG